MHSSIELPSCLLLVLGRGDRCCCPAVLPSHWWHSLHSHSHAAAAHPITPTGAPPPLHPETLLNGLGRKEWQESHHQNIIAHALVQDRDECRREAAVIRRRFALGRGSRERSKRRTSRLFFEGVPQAVSEPGTPFGERPKRKKELVTAGSVTITGDDDRPPPPGPQRPTRLQSRCVKEVEHGHSPRPQSHGEVYPGIRITRQLRWPTRFATLFPGSAACRRSAGWSGGPSSSPRRIRGLLEVKERRAVGTFRPEL